MASIVHIDFETFSEAQIKKVGGARYAADFTTDILMAAVAINDEPPLLWLPSDYRDVCEHQSTEADWVMDEWDDPETLVYAHNAQFEQFICRWQLSQTRSIPRLHQWRCTMAMARRAALPQALEKVAECLGLSAQKDKEGSRLLGIFSKLNRGKRIMPSDEPHEFTALTEYCLQDVRVEREVKHKLSAFEMKGDTLRTFQLDITLNHRGVPVNVSALHKAKVIVDKYQSVYASAFREATGLAPSQTVKALEWFRERGYPYKNMQAKSIDKALDAARWTNKPWWDSRDTLRALELRKLSSYAAVAKIPKMLDCQIDGNVYGTLLYYGAGTGRWSGKLIQPQNFKRPTVKNTDLAYTLICQGCDGEALELIFGNPLEVISSCIRHFIQWPGGNILDADYSAIEARIVCWLADQEDALERFRLNIDSYVDMATIIFGKPHKLISKDERWMGKQTVLGCGFQMGADKFYDQCVDLSESFGINGVVITKQLAQKSVTAFREKYDKVAQLWWATDAAAKRAVQCPGKRCQAGSKLFFVVVVSNGVPFLVMKLPSGRSIVYPWPRIEMTKKTFLNRETGEKVTKDVEALTFYGQIPNKQQWGRVQTYGGKLVENATQAVAVDIMANGAANAEDKGFSVLTLIHDEALAYDEGQSIDDYCTALTALPTWAAGLPVSAEGERIPWYKKT